LAGISDEEVLKANPRLQIAAVLLSSPQASLIARLRGQEVLEEYMLDGSAVSASQLLSARLLFESGSTSVEVHHMAEAIMISSLDRHL
jgi:hypothetical protein